MEFITTSLENPQQFMGGGSRRKGDQAVYNGQSEGRNHVNYENYLHRELLKGA